ncbi:hypothetical protein AMST5_02897 [freshwater sediment metagenome]|uniref:Uncharacterized protein n=1 Tax=freshwater sediment metagenome TaxID=556182 RepID=A0AA48RA88_9ZZZZ
MATIGEINSLLDRADKLLVELGAEYEKALNAKTISHEARNLTHEVIEKCTNALDQLMHHAWSTRVRPKLSEPPKRGGYFPAAKDEDSFRTSLGQWKALDLDTTDPTFARELRAVQPFSDPQNNWLWELRDISSKKHTMLIPQKRHEERRVTVSGVSGSVSWGPGVTFGGGVSLMGAPIDPRTQLPVATPGVATKVEMWVSFLFEGTDTNALGFCTEAVSKTRALILKWAGALSLP